MQFVLIHSPFVGPLTWLPTAQVLEEQGQVACVPMLDPVSAQAPYWPCFASRIAALADATPSNDPLVLIAHSAAGLLIPAVPAAMPSRTVQAYGFVDAALPRDGITLAERIPPGAGATLETLRGQAHAGLLPPWGSGWPEEFWAKLIPDARLRERFVAELRPLPLALYEEPTPTVPGWPDSPCCFLRFSSLYAAAEHEARRSGWRTVALQGQHLHMLVEPCEVANALMDLATSPTKDA